MELLEPILKTILNVWYLIPIGIVVLVLRSRYFKGFIGEYIVNKLLSKLPSDSYTLMDNVTLPTKDGTTQVDHIVVSTFGVFVIETKNMAGWIFGAERSKHWTQVIYKTKYKFQNPLRQNYKHIAVLRDLLGVPKDTIHSVIVFMGGATLKGDMPANVNYPLRSIRYIKRFDTPVFTPDECAQMVEAIANAQLKKGLVTNWNHRQHVRKIVAEKEAPPLKNE